GHRPLKIPSCKYQAVSLKQIINARETLSQIAGDFPRLGKPCCRLQGTFPSWGNLAASCRRLSPVGETLLQVAAMPISEMG
ncbi:hypothetical protein, partial [Plebeiibacterium marinum]